MLSCEGRDSLFYLCAKHIHYSRHFDSFLFFDSFLLFRNTAHRLSHRSFMGCFPSGPAPRTGTFSLSRCHTSISLPGPAAQSFTPPGTKAGPDKASLQLTSAFPMKPPFYSSWFIQSFFVGFPNEKEDMSSCVTIIITPLPQESKNISWNREGQPAAGKKFSRRREKRSICIPGSAAL